MTTLAQLRGQDRVVNLLRRAIAQGRVAHAYLFCGPVGSGKYTTGLALAAALNCPDAPGEGCGRCSVCERIFAGLHPDVQTLARQGAAQTIPIETIRTQVIPQLGLPPHEGRARVFLVEEAAAMQAPAANALLKTLEEPPPRTHFVLATAAPDALLPTIRSRCQRISFAALAPDVRAELDDDPAAAERLGALATELAAAARTSAPPGSVYRAAAAASQDRAEVVPVLKLLARSLHDAARAQADAAAENPAALARAGALARQASLVLDTETAVATHNAHGQLALESLLFALRRIRPAPATGHDDAQR